MEFANKVVLITGGAAGIGQALGREFLERGAKVSLVDINEKVGNEVVERLQASYGKDNVIYSKCDVSKEDEFEAAYNECETKLGTIDILCNNAGCLINDFKITNAVVYEGVVIGTEMAMKRMGKHNGGKGGIVVNTGSVFGAAKVPFVPFYSAAKAAVIHYSRCIGDEFHYKYSGVSVLCICPNGVDTEMVTQSVIKRGCYNVQSESAFQELARLVPKLRPEEVVAAVIQLIHENKTGEAMVIEKDVEPYYIRPAYPQEF